MAKRKKQIKTRSTLEDRVIASLEAMKAKFEYETLKIMYQKKPSSYRPDIVLDNGIIVEIKGYFDAEDRAKHLLIKEQHPELDIRFVFQDSRKKIHKSSTTTYGDWADAKGFIYADKEIPSEWVREAGNKEQVLPYRKPRLRRTT